MLPRYFSYGAKFEPALWSAFRQSHRIVTREEGPNDGLVSVASSRWGGESSYKGTLVGVSHLDLINWTNRLRWLVWELTGNKRTYVGSRARTFQCTSNKSCKSFNAVAFYLSIAGWSPSSWSGTGAKTSRYACKRGILTPNRSEGLVGFCGSAKRCLSSRCKAYLSCRHERGAV